jgi:predicted DNA-binding transcriptional regulator YafY
MIESRKINIYLVYKVLEEYTDLDHFLTMQEISNKIKEMFGIELDRKSVGNTIQILEELDFDIISGPQGKGKALASRLFDKNEITFIIDGIFSSKAIEGKQANDIVKKLVETLSIHDRKTFKYLFKTTEINRTSNKNIFYNIEIIQEAIEKGQNIKFKYMTYNEKGEQIPRFNGYEYQVSPYYLINNFGRYYLLGYRRRHEYTNVYRIDLMEDVKIDEERKIRPITELPDYKNGFSISSYINEHVYMFGGKSISVILKVNSAKAIQYIKDWFGDAAKIYNENDQIMASFKCNEQAFFYWIMQYAEHFEVISPESSRERSIQCIDNLSKIYKKDKTE